MTPASPSARPRAPLETSLAAHATRTLRLAIPVMIARAGILVLVAVDTAMTGHVGARELAYYGLAMAPQIPLLLVCIGLLLGTVVMTAQAHGAGHPTECGAIWRVSLMHAAAYGVVLLVCFQAGETLLELLGQAPGLARGGGRVLAMFSWGMPVLLLHVTTSLFLEGINRPTPGMVIMLLANILNVFLNWIFIFGHWGAPPMGAVGAALATTLVRYFLCVSIIGYVLLRVDARRYGLRAVVADARALGRKLWRIGIPMGISQGFESSAFAAMTLFAGLLGAVEVAGFQIALNLIGLPFMCSVGLATAASIRVGNAVGQRDPVAIKRAGWVAVGMIALLQTAWATSYLGFPDLLTAVYTTDRSVVVVAVPAVVIAAFVLPPDGIQGVLMGALRGTADVWPAVALSLLAYWGVMAPLGYYFGVHAGGGASALVGALGVGCTTAALLLGLRFHVVSRRTIARL